MSITAVPNVFVRYFLDSILHPPHMYISKIAACCAVLFLEQSDDALLHQLCKKWARCFLRDRVKLQCYHLSKMSEGDPLSEEERAMHLCASEELCNDEGELAVHFMAVMKAVAFRYFSFNWNSTDFMIRINREYAYYIRDNVFPLCVDMEGSDWCDESPLRHSILTPSRNASNPHQWMPPSAYSAAEYGSSSSCSVQSKRAAVDERSRTNSEKIFPCLSQTLTPTDLKPQQRRPFSEEVKSFSVLEGGDAVSFPSPTEFCSTYSTPTSRPPLMFSPRRSQRLQQRIARAPISHIAHLTWDLYESFMEDNTSGRLIVFHGMYCAKSNALRKVLEGFINRKPVDPMPKVGVVNTVSEPELTSLYNVSWFPTIIYTLPTDPGAAKSSACFDSAAKGKSEASMTDDSIIESEAYTSFSPVHRYDTEMTYLFGAFIGKEAKILPTRLRVIEESKKKSNYVASNSALSLSSIQCSPTDFEAMRGVFRVFPQHYFPSLPVLAEWIRSQGTYVAANPQDPNENVHNSILLTTDKLKGSLYAAVILLRRIHRPLRQSSLRSTPPPASRSSPLFVFLGGGMAAGKTTALRSFFHSKWWEGQEDAVMICADDFKPPSFDPQDRKAHKFSTKSAELLLVQAVNQFRNIVFDGTMMWAPFITQVVEMVRNAHKALFKPGVGYNEETKEEKYFECARSRAVPFAQPYKILCIGITVEPDIAVSLGLMRQFSSGRGILVKDQLKSFKFFSQNFSLYSTLVDSAFLLDNNVMRDLTKGELPPTIAKKEEADGTLRVLDDEAYALFQRHEEINISADSVRNLYGR